MNKNATEFDWGASESAPELYPMEVIKGTFIYKDEKEQGLYIPSGGTLDAGWGRAISSHTVGPDLKPLPDSLKIYFFSYTEKLFYKGEFKLPYETILQMFREGVAANPENPTYQKIVVGIAPGGAVAVWLKGVITREVFFGQAEKVDLDPSTAFALPFDSKEESEQYMQDGLEESLTEEQLAQLKEKGVPFGLWARYRNQYQWQPTFTEGHHPVKANVLFVNGEHERNWVLPDNSTLKKTHTVPTRLTFHTMMNGRKFLFVVNFDEKETMAAFEKLGANGEKIQLEFDPALPRPQLIVRLKNDDEIIELKKAISKDW